MLCCACVSCVYTKQHAFNFKMFRSWPELPAQPMTFTPFICTPQVAPGRYAAIEAPRTPRTLAQAKLNASATIRTGSPVQRWRAKEGQQDAEEWNEFAGHEGVVRAL